MKPKHTGAILRMGRRFHISVINYKVSVSLSLSLYLSLYICICLPISLSIYIYMYLGSCTLGASQKQHLMQLPARRGSIMAFTEGP